MKSYFCIFLFLFCLVGQINAQEKKGGVVKSVIEVTKGLKSPVIYNRFLINAVKDVDSLYTEYQGIIKKVWDDELKMDLKGSATERIEKIEKRHALVKATPIYKGGNEYQKATLDYLEAMQSVMKCLEKYGVLGAEESPDMDEYNKAQEALDESEEDLYTKRNLIQKRKDEYEQYDYRVK